MSYPKKGYPACAIGGGSWVDYDGEYYHSYMPPEEQEPLKPHGRYKYKVPLDITAVKPMGYPSFKIDLSTAKLVCSRLAEHFAGVIRADLKKHADEIWSWDPEFIPTTRLDLILKEDKNAEPFISVLLEGDMGVGAGSSGVHTRVCQSGCLVVRGNSIESLWLTKKPSWFPAIKDDINERLLRDKTNTLAAAHINHPLRLEYDQEMDGWHVISVDYPNIREKFDNLMHSEPRVAFKAALAWAVKQDSLTVADKMIMGLF